MRLLATVVSSLALALLVTRLGSEWVLGALFLAACAIPLLLWPQLATVLVLFVIYTNLPVVAARFHGVPDLLAAAVVFLLLVPFMQALVVRGHTVRIDATLFWMLIFLAALLLSTAVARDRSIAFQRIQTFLAEGLVLYLLVVNVLRGMPIMRRAIWALLVAGSLLGALSLYQSATRSYSQEFGGLARRNYVLAKEPLAPGNALRLYTHDRAQGPVNEPNRFAQILIVLLPLAAFAFRTAASRKERLFALAAAASILGGLVLTYSRGAFLTLAIITVLLAAVRWIRVRYLVVTVLALFVALPVYAPRYAKRVTSIADVRQLLGDRATITADGAIRGRATEMLAALRVFADHPVVGVGPGQYMPFYSEQYHQDGSANYRRITGGRRAHSLFFELAAETGIVGLAAFCAIIGYLMRELWRTRRRWLSRSPEHAALATALLLSLTAYLGTGFFLHLSYERYFWLLIALASAALHVCRTGPAASDRVFEARA